jgi:GntP family gluconate:H+ symporter
VRSIIALLGERRAPIAFLFSGYLLSVPVFFDNVFLMMVPLCKALWLRTGRNYLLSILAVIAGGSMDLSLMPPGPGPSMAASALGVDKGLMMLFGAMVGGCAASVGMLYAVWIDRRMQLPVRDTAQSTPADAKALGAGAGGMPPLWMSLVPVFIPVLLIASATICNLKWSPEQIAQFPAPVQNWITAAKWLGEPSMALASGAAAGIAVLVWIKRPRREQLRDVLGKALVDGGQILLLIAAGGAFGGTLQHTGIGGQLQHWIEQYDLPVLPVAFLVTTLVRGAQGSATVAMITAAGMFSTLATKERLGFHPVYLALMIGCGSKPLAWMNDAGFWMIGKMSGMTESETLRTFSVQLTIEGIVGAVVVTIMSKVFPMIG